ncbi:Small heat shock protein [Geitlerinema sp. FC II]|nr:Hsp20/alpha crystallin family protein [Geitlerinema sp. CS-897]PPT10962.1 Small heat shock protein [Geitlerinema sp. FC II]
MRFYTVNPFEELDRIERQLNRVFSEVSGENYSRNWSIAVELEERPEAFLLRALVPAIDRDDLDIEVTRDKVSIAGEYRKREPKDDKHRFYSEFPIGKFRRTIDLPEPITNSDVKAEYRDGILTLMLPKAPEAVHRVVKVNLLDTPEPKQIEAETTEG